MAGVMARVKNQATLVAANLLSEYKSIIIKYQVLANLHSELVAGHPWTRQLLERVAHGHANTLGYSNGVWLLIDNLRYNASHIVATRYCCWALLWP